MFVGVNLDHLGDIANITWMDDTERQSRVGYHSLL